LKNRLKVLRAESDWSQARLADELGVSRQTINAIETGRYDPSLPLAFELARVFGKKIEELFFPDGNTPERAKKPKAAASADSPEQLPLPELDVSLM